MVEDRVTNGERIAQLLASELSGREDGPLGRVSVVDADRTVEPTAEGAVAYGITVDGERIGDVRIYPDGAEIRVRSLDTDRIVESAGAPGLTAEATTDSVALRIEYGAAVKRAVDALVAGVEP